MRDEDYSRWLKQSVSDAVVTNYIKRCQRVEDNLRINLDDEYRKDKGISLLELLTYTSEDEENRRPLKCSISFTNGSNLRNGMASLKTAVKKYFEFCENDNYSVAEQTLIEKSPAMEQKHSAIDSYQCFLSYFCIDKQELYDWGIESTIFPPKDKIIVAWNDLKGRIFGNKIVYIRGYGRDAHGTQLFKDLYKFIFDNQFIEKDPTNNSIPAKHKQKLTGLKKNSDVINYQISHIWGQTKNVFLFEAPWNICYTPKIIDPFTGHETQGKWPIEFQNAFLAKTCERYREFIEEYNQLLIKHCVAEKLEKYLSDIKGTIPDAEYIQFEHDVKKELSPIQIN